MIDFGTNSLGNGEMTASSLLLWFLPRSTLLEWGSRQECPNSIIKKMYVFLVSLLICLLITLAFVFSFDWLSNC
jgi:hypothetical protein